MLLLSALLAGACATRLETGALAADPAVGAPTRTAMTTAATTIAPIPDPPASTAPAEPPEPVEPSPTPAPPEALEGAALVEALQGGGYVIYVRHAAADPTESDDDPQNLANCDGQRNLTEQGRAAAGTIGEAFRALDIPVGRVLSSAFCRARQTAQLAFGKTQITAELTALPADPGQDGSPALGRLLSLPPHGATNTVLVLHDLSLTATTGISIGEGEAAIFAPLGADGFTLVGRLLPQEWAGLAGLAADPAPGLLAMSATPPAVLSQGEPALSPSPGVSDATAAGAGSAALLLPDLLTLPPSGLVIEIDSAGDRKLLRLTNSIYNHGPGPLELLGVSDESIGKTTVTQRIYAAGGSFEEQLAGEFVFHPGHDHWHLENFARYELWSLTPGRDLDSLVAFTGKVSYCLRDNTPAGDPSSAPVPVYTSCDGDLQGISTGWIDIYEFDLAGQVVDISSVPDGVYALRSIADPDNQLRELDDANNAAMVYIQISADQVRIIEDAGELDDLLAGSE